MLVKDSELSREVIGSKVVTFNESIMFKDKLVADFEATREITGKENMLLEDITENGLARNSGSSRNINSEDVVQVTPEAKVRRSS